MAAEQFSYEDVRFHPVDLGHSRIPAQRAVHPPSTTSTDPVTNEDSSDAR